MIGAIKVFQWKFFDWAWRHNQKYRKAEKEEEEGEDETEKKPNKI